VITVRYFASLREQAGLEREDVPHESRLQTLYAALAEKHAFRMGQHQLRVAVNGDFVDWSRPLADGDEVVFIPPVSGG